jgi:hypothetical protein
MPGLSDRYQPVASDVSAHGCCLAGFRVERLDAVLDTARSVGYEVVADVSADLAPWSSGQAERIAMVQAPDGLLVELSES